MASECNVSLLLACIRKLVSIQGQNFLEHWIFLDGEINSIILESSDIRILAISLGSVKEKYHWGLNYSEYAY